MAPSGCGEGVQPDAPLPPISNCVGTAQMLGLDRDFPVRRRAGKKKQDAKKEVQFVPLHVLENKTRFSVCFLKQKEYDIFREPINVG